MLLEKFEFYQPAAGSDPVHTAKGPCSLDADIAPLTPIMLEPVNGVLVPWDGQAAGTACGLSALNTVAGSSSLTYFKSGTWRYEDIVWPEADELTEAKKRNAFVGTQLSVA
jgi:hypothetical protein